MRDSHAAMGPWQQTYTGRRFYPADPKPHSIFIQDIAHALSNLCRFGGHCMEFYSVAQHSVYVSYQVPPEHALQALLHDATEAYLVDVPKPLKTLLPGYVELENRLWAVIAQRFKVPVGMHESVKRADLALLLAERDWLMAPTGEDWDCHAEGVEIPKPAVIDTRHAFRPRLAKEFFLNRYYQLTGNRT